MVYEWNRGVIGISQSGNVIKFSLDDTSFHHSAITRGIIRLLNGKVEYSISPFEIAVNGSNQGILILQFEGDKVLMYFPSFISEEQYKALIDIIFPRSEFIFSYVHNGQIFEEQSIQCVSNFVKNILSSEEVILLHKNI